MILIIEGPDLSGKTTAIEKIGKFYNRGFTLKNNFKPKNKQSSEKIYTHYWRIFKLITHEPFVILDRCFPSQAVYSYLRGTDELRSKDIMMLDKFASRTNCVYIYLDTNLKELERRYMDRGDEHISIDDLERIKTRYDLFYELTRMKKIRINTIKDNWFGELRTFIEEAQK